MKYNFNEEVSFFDDNYLKRNGIIRGFHSNNTYTILVGNDFYYDIHEYRIWRDLEKTKASILVDTFYNDFLLEGLSERMKRPYTGGTFNRFMWLSSNEGENKEMSKLPRKVFFNKNKKATTLIFGDKPTVVKCGKGDKYSKRVGFLEAYFQATCGLSKTQAKKYLDKIIEEDAK